jgi:hypothetical protein
VASQLQRPPTEWILAMNLLFMGFLLVTIGLQGSQSQDQLSDSQAVTVSGCVAQAQRTGSLADDTPTATVATPNTAGIEANSGEPVNAYVLLDASPVAERGGRRGSRTSYALNGHEAELATHKGHRVEIVGHLEAMPRVTTNSKMPATTTRRIAVNSIKMVADRCPSAQPEFQSR